MPAFAKSAKPPSVIRVAPPIPAQQEPSPQLLTNTSLDILHRFLSYVDPDAADLLPLPEGSQIAPDSQQSQVPISDWDVLYSASTPPSDPGADGFSSSITVRSHPDPNRNLFCVQSTIPGVTARQFWSLMASAENRKLWDSTVEDGSVKRWLADASTPSTSSDTGRNPAVIADALAARVESFRFGSIFMVAKARDMVLLSVDARLPPKDGSTQNASDGPLRLVSSSQSIVDPSLPPRKGYTRFELQTAGFMVEDLGDDGVPESACVPVADLATSPPVTKGAHMAKGLRALGRKARSASGSKHFSSPSEAVDSGPSYPKAPIRDSRGPAVLVTQVSDLGEMAAWVPASVIRMVASTLVPRSIASVVKVAKTMPVSSSLYQNYTRPSSSTPPSHEVEQLGKNAGEWYRHRILPAMIGHGVLQKQVPTPVAIPEPVPVEPVAPPRSPSHLRVPEPVLSSEVRSFAANVTNIPPPTPDTPAPVPGTPKRTAAPIPHIPLAASPPPRTSSLPGTPVLNRVAPAFLGSPTNALGRSSPTKRPMVALDHQRPPGSPAKRQQPALNPSALGLDFGSAAPLDDLVSSAAMSPSNFRSKALAQSPTKVPGLAPAFKEKVDKSRSEQKAAHVKSPRKPAQERVKDITTTNRDQRGQPSRSTDATAMSPVSPTPGMLGSHPPMSPAEKRSRMLSNEYYAPQNGAASDEHKVQRLSNALVAEMERRQVSVSGFSPRSADAKPLPDDKPPHNGGDLVAMLADALAESMPFVPVNAGQVRDQARRVSALLLAGSDALALTLAPGARDSLGLRFDSLSTASEQSEPVTPRDSRSMAAQSKHPTNLGRGSQTSASASGKRKPSVDTATRSISITASHANVVASTESVISRKSQRSEARAKPAAQPSDAPDTADGGDTKAVETLRELNRASQRSSRPVKRSLAAQSALNRAREDAKPVRRGYGAALLGGLAYYSGYSWYATPSASTAEEASQIGSSSARPASVPASRAASVRARGKVSATSLRRRSRANYMLENNAKLHPFPGSFSRRTGQASAASVRGAPSMSKRSRLRRHAAELPPPITGLGVGAMERLPTQTEHPAP